MHGIYEKRVLIVDDEDNIRNLLSDFFSLNGYWAGAARNGSEALRILKEEPCNLLVTDLNMPEMDGIELIRAVRNLYIPLAIIGMSQEDKEYEFLEVGADYFLLKPFNFLYLKSILNNILRQ